jgi:hypothetical protein
MASLRIKRMVREDTYEYLKMKICTVAIGESYLAAANNFKKIFPDLKIYYNIPKEVTHHNNKFNFNCKKYAIKREYDKEGTLFIDADSSCLSFKDFNIFIESSRKLPPGIYSPYVFSSYGWTCRQITDKILDRSKITEKLKIFEKEILLTDDNLLNFYMPYEWFMLFKFRSKYQKSLFFKRWEFLEDILKTNTPQNYRNECNLIGLAALYANLPIQQISDLSQINYIAGIKHK